MAKSTKAKSKNDYKKVRDGLLITFEGIDGSGKSTQLDLCAKYLKNQGYGVLKTFNPGGMDFGKQLREILLHYEGDLSPVAELMLFLADRAQHTQEVIQPALAAGKIVLCDRHIDSTTAYQGYGRGLSVPKIHELNHMAIAGRLPDATLLFDGDPDELSKRVRKRGQADRLEAEDQAFHQRVRQGFISLSQQQPQRFYVFDALQKKDDLHQAVMLRLEPLLERLTSQTASV